MLKSFFLSRQWLAWAWGGLIFLILLLSSEVYLQILLNDWYRITWDLLGSAAGFTEITETSQGLHQFINLLVEFCILVFPLILLQVVSDFLAQHYTFRWRQAISFAYRPYWEETDSEIEGAAQRMQEDTRDFAQVLETLGLGLIRAVMTLFAFLPILWLISQQLMQTITGNMPAIREKLTALPEQEFLNTALFGMDFIASVPGSLVWIAALIALLGTGISCLVGIKLPGLHYNNQKVEASFRKRMTYAEDNKQYADLPSFIELFSGLRLNYFRLYLHTSYFRLWEYFFYQTLIIVDFILVAPGVIAGIITLGVLNQISHAFSKVSDSFSYLIGNWVSITSLISIIKRLQEFEKNIDYSNSRSADAENVQVIK